MDSHELNKIVGAVLATLLLVFGIRIISNMIFDVPDPEVPGYAIVVPEEGTAGTVAEVEVTPLPVLLAAASVSDGQRLAGRCISCHTFDDGGAHRQGPNLYDIMGDDIATRSGFNYSAALTAVEGEWTWEKMSAFLEGPSAAVPGTTMSFAGLRRPEERANVLVYLNSLSANPLPLPAVEEVVEEAEPIDAEPVVDQQLEDGVEEEAEESEEEEAEEPAAN